MTVLNVYPGRDRPCQITVSLNGAVVDFTAVTRMLLTFRESVIVADTDVDPTLINWSSGAGVVIFNLSALGLAPGVYSANLFAYDAGHTNGQPIVTTAEGNPLQFKIVADQNTTLLVQDDNGTVAGANAYINAAYFSTYHNQRGNAVEYDTDQIEQAIIRATDYLDDRFNFVGRRRNLEQDTAWPRNNAWDRDRFYQNGIPSAVKQATAEYALRALSAALAPDPVADETGAAVQSKSEEVGPIKQAVTYVSGASFIMPRYPAADRKLTSTGLVLASGQVMRG